MRPLLLLLLSMSVYGQQEEMARSGCPVERGQIKTTLTDVNRKVLPITIAQLVKLKAPSESALKGVGETKRFPAETQVHQASALLLGYKLEADSDFHLVIADPDTKETMIAEITSPICTKDNELAGVSKRMRADLQKRFGLARPRFHNLSPPKPVTITGVLMFDVLHGQKGVAVNGIELHPVLALEISHASRRVLQGVGKKGDEVHAGAVR